MARVSRVLRSTSHGFTFWCPGCEYTHWVRTRPDGSLPVWTFDGNLERPTFGPSVRHFVPAHTDNGVSYPERTTCHYFVVAGEIRYCGDCEHALSGKTVPLPDLPSGNEYGYGDE